MAGRKKIQPWVSGRRSWLRSAAVVLILSAILPACSKAPSSAPADRQLRVLDSLAGTIRDTARLAFMADSLESSGNLAGESVVLMQLGKVLRETSVFSDAIEVHRRGYECASLACDTIGMVQHLNNIGTNFRRLGILDEASVYHYRALLLCEQYSDTRSTSSRKNRVVSLNGIGNVQLTLGNSEAADSAFRAALRGEKQLGSDLGQAINYANLGSIFEERGQIDSARAYYQKSLEYNTLARSDLGVSLCYSHFGRLAENEGRWDEALSHYTRAYKIMEDSDDQWHWLEACISLARVNLHKSDYSTAKAYLSKARSVAQQINSIEHLAIIYDLEYQYYRKLGNPTLALDRYMTARAYSDSLATVTTANHMQNVRVRYERDRRQKEIDLAQKNYLAEKRAHNSAILAFIALAIVAVLVIAFLVIANHNRAVQQKMMQKMETMRSNFFTNITHEFRTPLTAIMGLSRDIGNGNIRDERQLARAAAIINRQGQGLLEIVNQLLDISRIKSEIGSPNWRRGDVTGYVSMLAEVYSQAAKDKGVELQFVCSKQEVTMDFVPDYLKKIVRNLLSNAIKFSRDGGHIYVEVIDKGDNVVLRVSDEGEGIDSMDLPHIFEPFYMGTNSSTGVGLSLVSQLVEAMDGTITVHSVRGKGSIFTVTLPAVHDEDGVVPEPALEIPPVESLDDTAPEDFPSDDDESIADDRPVVLIVEDNSDIAWYIGSHLQEKYRLLFASNGRIGLDKAIQNIPDIIVTDYLMPEMDGLQLCSAVRHSDLLNHIPVIMVTAKVAEADMLKGLETGADAYLKKPFNSEELDIRVSKLLEQRRLLREKYSKGAVESKPDDDFLRKLVDFILASLASGEKIDVTSCAAHMCVCSRQFNRKINALTGNTPSVFINQVKVGYAKRLLVRKPDLSISQISIECGFEDPSYFSKIFRQLEGISPSEYKN